MKKIVSKALVLLALLFTTAAVFAKNPNILNILDDLDDLGDPDLNLQ